MIYRRQIHLEVFFKYPVCSINLYLKSFKIYTIYIKRRQNTLDHLDKYLAQNNIYIYVIRQRYCDKNLVTYGRLISVALNISSSVQSMMEKQIVGIGLLTNRVAGNYGRQPIRKLHKEQKCKVKKCQLKLREKAKENIFYYFYRHFFHIINLISYRISHNFR